MMSPSGLGVFGDEDDGHAGQESSFYNASDDVGECATEWAACGEAAAAGAAATPEQ